jgi:hypothetical protein
VSQGRELARPAPSARLLAALPAVVAALLVALSFVPRWIVHQRAGAGEPTEVLAYNAWHGPLVPPLVGIALAVIAGAIAVARLAGRRRVSVGAIFAAELLAVAALVAFAWPIASSRDALDVTLTPGWATWVGLGLAAVACVSLAPFVRWPLGRLATLAAIAIVLSGVLVGGRAVGLRYDTGTGERRSDGAAAALPDGARPSPREPSSRP